jgi:hypothetical protein
MKVYDPISKRVLNEVVLYLTPAEAQELGQSALDLAENPQKHHHHVSASDFQQEITVSVYTPDNVSQFDAASRKIIQGS